MSREKDELRHRVEAKRKQLEGDLERFKADATAKTGETERQIESKLQELREQISSGWEQLSNEAAHRLNEWLREDNG